MHCEDDCYCIFVNFIRLISQTMRRRLGLGYNISGLVLNVCSLLLVVYLLIERVFVN